MTRNQWMFDCMEKLPKLYSELRRQYMGYDYEDRKEYICTHNTFKDFAKEHQIDVLTLYYLGESYYLNVREIDLIQLADTIFGKDEDGVFIVPEGITHFDSYHLYKVNKNFHTIVFPKSLNSIGSKTFYGNESLKTVIFPKDSNLTIIYEDAFAHCDHLDNINIPLNATVCRQALRHTYYLDYYILTGEKDCPVNIFNSLNIVEQSCVCLNNTNLSNDLLSIFYENIVDEADYPTNILSLLFSENNMKIIDLFYKMNILGTHIETIINLTEEYDLLDLRLRILNHIKEQDYQFKLEL